MAEKKQRPKRQKGSDYSPKNDNNRQKIIGIISILMLIFLAYFIFDFLMRR